MNRIITIFALFAVTLAAGCGRERPDDPDGEGAIVVSTFDTSGFFQGSVGGEAFPMDSAEVSIQGRTSIFAAIDTTNESGEVSFDGLPTGDYSIFVRRQVRWGPTGRYSPVSATSRSEGRIGCMKRSSPR